MKGQKLLIAGLLAVALAEGAYIVAPLVIRRALPAEVSGALAGRNVAAKAGCFGCHGDGGHGGVPNLGTADGKVPGFRQGIVMMYAESDQELREWILDGMPQRLAKDPDFQASRKSATMRMPAFREKLAAAEVEQLVLYVKSAAAMLAPQAGTPEARGFDVAYESGCFGCHGDGGMGGIGNLGSLKGYIPGFWGDDYRELVRSDGELRAWIEDGIITRLANDPIARPFVQGQVITMPAFKGRLDEPRMAALMAYVKWVNASGWRSGARAEP